MVNISSLIAPSGVATTTGQDAADWEAGTGTTESTVSPAKVKSAIDSLAPGGFSTRERLDGSGTYTVPAGVTRIRVYIVGGGAASDSGFGPGGNSNFGGFVAGGGSPGFSGEGGSGGFGGGTGCSGNGGNTGGGGGSGGFGGGGSVGEDGIDGGGAGSEVNGGAGGGGGGLNVQEIDTSPGATFSYSAGSGGAALNSQGYSGKDGGDGFIIVEY